VPLQQPLPLELVRHHLDLVARAAPSHQSINHIKTTNRTRLEKRKEKFRRICAGCLPAGCIGDHLKIVGTTAVRV
jgi:hypothetical protein